MENLIKDATIFLLMILFIIMYYLDNKLFNEQKKLIEKLIAMIEKIINEKRY